MESSCISNTTNNNNSGENGYSSNSSTNNNNNTNNINNINNLNNISSRNKRRDSLIDVNPSSTTSSASSSSAASSYSSSANDTSTNSSSSPTTASTKVTINSGATTESLSLNENNINSNKKEHLHLRHHHNHGVDADDLQPPASLNQLIECLNRHHQQQQLNSSNYQNNQTLMDNNHLLHHHIQQQQQQQQQRFCVYSDLNDASMVEKYQELPAAAHQSIVLPTNQATTAYLVQTPNGNALLIPPQNNLTLQQKSNLANNFSMNRNPYGLTAVPIQNSATINQMIDADEKNVYQTIDPAEKPNYIFPPSGSIINPYEFAAAAAATATAASRFNSSLATFNRQESTNTSARHKKHNYQQQQQQLFQTSMRQAPPSLVANELLAQQKQKLVESHNNSSNLTGSLLSNTNNKSSNFFTSPALSALTNRRLKNDSVLERLKPRFSRLTSCYYSWKCLSLFLINITMFLVILAVYLSIMKAYNLNWRLQESAEHRSAVAASSIKNSQLFNTDRKQEQSPLTPVLFTRIGDLINDDLQPNEFYNFQLSLNASAYVKFSILLNKNCNVGFYGEKNAVPTFTKFKIFQVINYRAANSKRIITLIDNQDNKQSSSSSSSSAAANSDFLHFLDAGFWYFSIFNDNKFQVKFQLKSEFFANKNNENCPRNCFNQGDCVSGKCVCYPGYTGFECSVGICPMVCSGHGRYENGKCNCDSNWHGAECSLPIDECEVPDCNGNGECYNGKCECYAGFDGDSCERVTCLNRNCSNNGVCHNAKCVCFANYTGDSCDQLLKVRLNNVVIEQQQLICSGHGTFNYETKECSCNQDWSGADCSLFKNCLDKDCKSCKKGWSGVMCQAKEAAETCNPKCIKNGGICNANGSCICSPGFSGRFCDINNCPSSCSSNGVCERQQTGNHFSHQILDNTTTAIVLYHCVCNQGWTGKACDVAIETVCNDNKDNDQDGLVDCMDSECCVFDNCKLSLACQTSPEPKDRLLRKQPSSLSATFYDKVRFMIEDGSVQLFANTASFSESQVSVIRGQVLYKNGQPLIGVKVSCKSNPAYGYTLTRNNGIFDLLINGGGSVLIEFSRDRLKTRQISVLSGWNQFVHLDQVVLYLSDDEEESLTALTTKPQKPCRLFEHDSSSVYHVAKTSWKEIRSYVSESDFILPDSGIVRTKLPLSTTGSESSLNLVYTSNLAAGYTSSIFVLLTQETIPDDLKQVHLKISVEGVLHKQTFDAYANLKYEFSWDRRNAYDQRVYGITQAKVMVGYQYDDCEYIYWQSSVVKLAGFDLASSEIGTWNVDVHHRLNTQQGILYKGDGTLVYIKEIEKLAEIVVSGDKFVSPYSLSINKDGAIFIADQDKIWTINSMNEMAATLKAFANLNVNQPFKYGLANEPFSGNLYATDPVKRTIFSPDNKLLANNNDSYSNNHLLNYPKALTFDNDGVAYFIDGNEIKMLNINTGFMRTIISNDQQQNEPVYRPMGCNSSFLLSEMRFFWPLSIAVNPLDNSINVLDEKVIYKITNYNRVEVLLGTPYGCQHSSTDSIEQYKMRRSFKFFKLNNPIDISFSPDGDLFILENDKAKNLKQIRILKSNGEIEHFFPTAVDINSNNNNNSIINKNRFRSGFIGAEIQQLNDPVAIAVHKNRSVYVLDKGDNVLYHIRNNLNRDEETGKYRIASLVDREVYIFNRFGLHLSTLDLDSGNSIYNFTYNGNTLHGKLVSIHAADKQQPILSVKRDFHGRAESLNLPNSVQMKIKLNNFDMLRSMSINGNKTCNLNYLANLGLLTSKYEYEEQKLALNYEKNGKIKEITERNGTTISISYSINPDGIVTEIKRSKDDYSEIWINNRNKMIVLKNGQSRSSVNQDSFKSFANSMKTSINNRKFKQRQQF